MPDVKPTILLPDYGALGKDLPAQRQRIERGRGYRDLSTVCITPIPHEVVEADGRPIRLTGLPIRVVSALRSLMVPMNQAFYWVPIVGMEVGAAYEQALDLLLTHPVLSEAKFLLCLEHDNVPPPDGLLKLFESIDEYAVVGGLYWTKGEGGQPMCYGNPSEMPRNYRPQMPEIDKVQEVNGTGQGFTLFRTDVLKDPRIKRPLFRTAQDYEPGVGVRAMTQDLYAYEQLRSLGYRIAVDTRVRVGHIDLATDTVW